MTKEEYNKHKVVFEKWIKGEKLQYYNETKGEWVNIENPLWNYHTEYRIYPRPKKIEFKDCTFCLSEYIVDESDVRWINPLMLCSDARRRYALFKEEVVAKAYAILPKLIRIMGQYNKEWIPNWKDSSIKYILYYCNDDITKNYTSNTRNLLAFKSEEIRDRFLEDHEDLIKIAKPLL